MSKDTASQIKAEMKVLATDADEQARHDSAEKLYSSCKKCVQAGQKGVIVSMLPQLIGLLDDKDAYVVFWVASVIGCLGNEGKAALPKLEKLSAARPLRRETKSQFDAVDAAIKQIRGVEGEKQLP